MRLVITDAQLLKQWHRVLRLQPSQRVTLFNDSKDTASWRIEALSAKQAILTHVASLAPRTPSHAVTLAWSVLKKENNDWIIQKATELGVTQLIPLQAEHCVANRISTVKQDRWQKIIVEAAEQCGRSDVPQLQQLSSPQQALRQLQGAGVVCVADMDGLKSIAQVVQSESAASVFIGPEGGWSAAERSIFQSSGAVAVTLGDFTLRAETAAIVAVATMILWLP